MKRRIFLAIDLPQELKAQIAEMIKQWQWLPIRWLKPENWHITIIPPAYLDDNELAALVAIFKKSSLGGGFAIRFSQILLAPPGVRARMIWLEGETPPELIKLKKKLERAWSSQPALPRPKEESRPLKLHVTLARFQPGDLRELEEKTRVLGEINFAFEAKEVVIIESHLKPTGAEYEILTIISLL